MSDPQPPTLTELLARATDDPATRPDFMRALLDGDVFVFGSRLDDLDPPERISIMRWTDRHGEYLPFYTSLEQVHRTRARVPELKLTVFRLSTREFLEIAKGGSSGRPRSGR